MNKHLSLLTAALLLTGASSAFAASSTDLTVTGLITPASCTPSLVDGGVVDYGKLSAKDLNPTASTPLDEKTIRLTVNCDASTPFAISTIDNRKETPIPSSNINFGLGEINGTEKLGYYNLRLVNPVADVPVTTLQSRDNGGTWESMAVGLVRQGNLMGFGNQTGGVWAPDHLQNLSLDVSVKAYIARADSLTLTDEVKLDGSATFQIKYL
jgi:type 1 fimbria pilin